MIQEPMQIQFSESKVAHTLPLTGSGGNVNIDYDDAGYVVGIEVLLPFHLKINGKPVSLAKATES